MIAASMLGRISLDDLATAAIAGGEAEFALLVSACRPMIAGHTRRINFRSAAVGREDLEQHAVIAIHEALGRWDPSRGNFRTFANLAIRSRLLTIATRDSAKSKRQWRYLKDYAEPLPNHFAAVEAGDEAISLLARLTRRERLMADYIATGCTHDEIGRRIGLTAHGVHSAIARMRKKIRAPGTGRSRE